MAIIVTISTAISSIVGNWSITITNTTTTSPNTYSWLGF